MKNFGKEIEEVFCNMCKGSCAMSLTTDGDMENEGLLKVRVIGGYPSTPGNGDGALDDMTQYEFSLCEFCLDFIFSNFRIPPRLSEIGQRATIEHLMSGGENDIGELKDIPFESATERVLKDEWRKEKKEFFNRKIEHDLARNICKKPIEN